MYTVNSKTEKALMSDGRTFKAYIEVEDDNGNVVTLDDFYKLEIKGASTDSTEAFQIGTSVATQISITMENPTITLTGKEIKLYLGIVAYDEDNEEESTIEYVPMGVYIPEKPTVSNNQISFEAFDKIGSKLAKEYISELNYPCDVNEVLVEIETLAGVMLSEKPTGLVINKRVESEDGVAVIYTNPFDGYTYAQTLGMIAGYYGKFATMTRTGEVEFRGYSLEISGEKHIIPKDSSYSDISEQEETFNIGYLQCTVDNDLVLKSGEGKTGINFSCMLMTQDRLDELYEEYKNFSYTPTTLSFKGDFRLDLGDMVSVERLDGTTIDLPIMSLSHTYDGGLKTTVGSYGTTEETDGYISPTEKAISRVYQKLAVVENLIATKTLTVGQIKSQNLLDNSLTCVGDNIECIPLYDTSKIGYFEEKEAYLPPDFEVKGICGYFNITSLVSENDKGCMVRVKDILKIGQWYTVSFYSLFNDYFVPDSNKPFKSEFTIQILNEKQRIINSFGWGKYVFTFKAEKEDLDIYILSPYQSIQMYQMQIEQGKYATQYCEKFDSINDVINESKDLIKNFCYDNDMTYIDGGKIYAGTITSKQLNVDDLFAEDITATGNFKIENDYLSGGEDYKFLFHNIDNQIVLGTFKEYTDRYENESGEVVTDTQYLLEAGTILGKAYSKILCDVYDMELGRLPDYGDSFCIRLRGNRIFGAGFSSTTETSSYVEIGNASEFIVNAPAYFTKKVSFKSSWVNLSPSSNFELYTSGSYPRYKIVGNTVFLTGTVKPKATIKGSTEGVVILTLPVEARPPRAVMQICQGSGMNRWLLRIQTNGDVEFSRYGTDALADATTSTWLPFYVTYAID